MFSIEGVLVVEDNPLRIYNISGVTRTMSKVALAVGTAPTGGSIIVDIHKNGTTIFTNQDYRPLISATQTYGESTGIGVSSWEDGDYLTMHVDQKDSDNIGADLTVHIKYV